ncbi:CCA tRNA nucleotidyltransferase [Aliiroseovarius sp. S2029]|uniref:CCA tRNA nucleotidyltransferase n=1 Tax=Aliiroseovarius sp. S2029 TaxID=2936988 RepID=UPI0020C09844|nr:CCA tRNA nucleotidyltransferase [Aliiroseovarius sp. S2029]MCK8484444.1 CCA tRNA nucleotidyltransferase [Aliiroseovarius sp. S2029]
MTRVTGEWIRTDAAQAVCTAIAQAGHQVFFVGGCVRNDLLGAPISDLDLSTDARPDRIMQVATDAGLRAVPTGIDHGTVTVIADGIGLEVTTFRKDVETDGRRAVVAFSDRLEDDAHRRDFTMNALYATPDGFVVDPLGGLADLAARRVRFIDDPGDRIREDYLRILRFFRFHAWYGDPSRGMDQDALAGIAANLGGLETLSRERVGVEMLKLLAAPDPAPAIATMAQIGVLGSVLPGAEARVLPALIHLEGHLEGHRASDPLRRLAALGGQDVAARLRLSRRDRKRYERLRDEMGNMVGAGELAYHDGAEFAQDVVLLRAAQMGQPIDTTTADEIKAGAQATFPVQPADLMPKLTGPALGAELRRLEQLWIASGFTLTRKDLLP